MQPASIFSIIQLSNFRVDNKSPLCIPPTIKNYLKETCYFLRFPSLIFYHQRRYL